MEIEIVDFKFGIDRVVSNFSFFKKAKFGTTLFFKNDVWGGHGGHGHRILQSIRIVTLPGGTSTLPLKLPSSLLIEMSEQLNLSRKYITH